MDVKIKICGITNGADAQMAAAAGADLLGFIFHEASPRFVPLPALAEITHGLPAHVLRVGVFVNPTEEFVFAAMRAGGLNLLQFHGEETPEFCLRFGLPSIKAFAVSDEASLAALPRYATDAYLLDAFVPGERGGTGRRFNWDLAVRARDFGKPVILAGGLAPGNVGEAAAKVRPFAVDVSSGVERAPGKKDPAKVRAFIANARQANGV